MTKLIFEKSKANTNKFYLEESTKEFPIDIPQVRKEPLALPDISEVELVRHYTALSKKAYGVDDGFYPLGSCTMKYNPKISEDLASLEGFTAIHPLQPINTVEGCLKVIKELKEHLQKITGMADFTLAPAAGAHGEFAGLLMTRKYHENRSDFNRKKVLIPDSAHGTNPASANMCGLEVLTVPSNENGLVDIKALKEMVNEETACLMLTNPNTLGLFEKEIKEMAEIVHQAGGLLYYDGANLNAIMGICKPADMGFDIVHLNLHKTFATPHGAGGPGSGPVGCVESLREFLPNTSSINSVGLIKAYHGNYLVLIKALTYIKLLGYLGIKETAQNAVLNANYLMHKLNKVFTIPYFNEGCMHEFVISMSDFKENKDISAMDLAKALIDEGIHPPTMYFPLIVKEALMIEPTETETKENLDDFIEKMFILANKSSLHDHPKKTPVNRVDEVLAARQPKLKYRG